jgi:uncharacterized radical SAM superfamily Fe-S cluster-containing enzyme
MPQHVLLNLTTFCQANCAFCIVYDSLNRPDLNMTDEQIFTTLRDARAGGATEVGYTGGEPSIHPRFLEIVRFAKELGYTRQSLNTNGIKFKQAKFCREAVEAGISSIDFSIHGHTEALHDGLVDKKGAFAAIKEACEHLRALRSEFKFVLSGTVVVTSKNHENLRNVCEFMTALGIDHQRIKYAYEGDQTAEKIIQQVPPYEQVVPSVQDAIDYLAGLGKGFHFTHVPLCLLGAHAAFSQDFERRRTLMVFRGGAEEGEAANYFRTSAEECRRCVAAPVCTRLDGAYARYHGRPTLKPFSSHDELEQMFDAAEARFTKAQNVVKYFRRRYRENRDAPPAPVLTPVRMHKDDGPKPG